MLIIPPLLPASPRPVWDISTTVLGAAIRVRLVWHARPAAWFLDLWCAGEELVRGLRVVEGISLLWRYRWPQLPSGHLICVAIDGSHSEPTYEGLGVTHRFYWGEVSDLAETVELASLLEVKP